MMISGGRAIETAYSGRLFRSRLEARWAVFFDALSVPWVYEPEGYRISESLCYLPDFYLPQQQAFIEIKAAPPTEIEASKAVGLSVVTGRRVLVFFGLPGHHQDGGYPSGQDPMHDGAYLYSNGGMDNYYAWCVCLTCGRYGIEFDGRGSRICRHSDDDKGYSYDSPLILNAYDAANRARFRD